MKKALVVGINHYRNVGSLHGCVNDAHSVNAMLERDANGSRNFHTRLMTAISCDQEVSRVNLRLAIQELFQGDSDIALLYFAGHGYIEAVGGFLCSSDVETGDDGIALSEIVSWANDSPARHKIIILDSCHSGVAGKHSAAMFSELNDGMTILTASTAEQYASEKDGSGIFTNLLVDALGGAAANLVGKVTPGSVYAHIDQSLGPWAQRPVFKTNVKTFASLREVTPPLEPADLRRISEFFPRPDHVFPLDPTYEPERSPQQIDTSSLPAPDPVNTAVFGILQKYNRVNLVVPVNAPHMWHAAMGSKACELTPLGRHYRRLVDEGMI